MRLILRIVLASAGMAAAFAQPVPDFQLRDVSAASTRHAAVVSPRDYIMQVSGYYFGSST
jgi:hypothetical protein